MTAFSFCGLLSISSVAVFASGMTAVGCGGSENSVFTEPAAADAAPPPDLTMEAGNLFPDDGGGFDASKPDAAACAPSPIPASFAPIWKPPAITPSACTTTQIGAYYEACLKAPIDSQACATFTKANKACGSCLESDENASKYGPIIWHANRVYFTFNIAGCIAALQTDVTGASCGASYQAAVSCKQLACEPCFAGNSDFDRFNQCEKVAGSAGCATYGQTEATKCAGLHDADASTNACFLNGGETNKDLLVRIGALFCGP